MNAPEEPGRFLGDLQAVLSYDPLARKPYRVEVGVWHHSRWTEHGEPEWLESRRGEGREDDVTGGFYPVRDFRSLDRAVRYLYEVRGEAELRRLRRIVRDQAESRREVLS